jgi:hypothetical protein
MSRYFPGCSSSQAPYKCPAGPTHLAALHFTDFFTFPYILCFCTRLFHLTFQPRFPTQKSVHSKWYTYGRKKPTMAPGILSSSRSSSRRFSLSPIRTKVATIVKNCLLNRSVNVTPLRASAGIGNEYILEDGTRIYDASGGAAVANIGKKSPRVMRAMKDIHDQGLAYVSSFAFDTKVTAELANWMITSTENKMSKAVFYCSGMVKLVVFFHAASLTL